jgi:hypothetical protein
MSIQFRKDRVDVVAIIDSEDRKSLTDKIVSVGNEYDLIDVQYAITKDIDKTIYSALLLLKKKRISK